MEELNQTKGLLNTAINHTTDNPIVNTEAKNDRWYSNAEVLDEMRAGKPTVYVNSCSNFDNTQLARLPARKPPARLWKVRRAGSR